MALVTGARLGHYEIRSKIGEGGMGEVYLAHDTTHDRKVALKILPADVASNRDRMERFIREAKSAAALNHPNIAHVYEIGEGNGAHYIAMDFFSCKFVDRQRSAKAGQRHRHKKLRVPLITRIESRGPSSRT